MIRQDLRRLIGNVRIMGHVMTQTGLGSVLSIRTLIRATFVTITLTTIASMDQAAACSTRHASGQPASYGNTVYGSNGGFLA